MTEASAPPSGTSERSKELGSIVDLSVAVLPRMLDLSLDLNTQGSRSSTMV